MKLKLHMDVKLPYIHMSPLEYNTCSFNGDSLLNTIHSYSILWQGEETLNQLICFPH